MRSSSRIKNGECIVLSLVTINDQLQEKVNVKDQDKFFFLKRILLFVNYLNNNRIINYNVLKTTTNKKNKK